MLKKFIFILLFCISCGGGSGTDGSGSSLNEEERIYDINYKLVYIVYSDRITSPSGNIMYRRQEGRIYSPSMNLLYYINGNEILNSSYSLVYRFDSKKVYNINGTIKYYIERR